MSRMGIVDPPEPKGEVPEPPLLPFDPQPATPMTVTCTFPLAALHDRDCGQMLQPEPESFKSTLVMNIVISPMIVTLGPQDLPGHRS